MKTQLRRPLLSCGRYAFLGALLLGVVSPSTACIVQGHAITGAQSFRIDVTAVNGVAPPTADNPLPANRGNTNETWDIDVQATDASGQDTAFDGFVRVTVRPGTVLSVLNLDTNQVQGRNLLLSGGHGRGRVTLTAVFGPSRAWVEDLGYSPAPAGKTPECADGINNDPKEDKLIDFPNDPGCAFADDDTETGGTFTAGTSPPVAYFLPTVRDVQGASSETPFPYEALQVKTTDPAYLVVTRISKDGFYVTDLNDAANGYNHLFAFNFSTPSGMQVCDHVTYLSGTMSEFFGFTEMNFPSYRLDPLFVGQEDMCRVPEPTELADLTINDPVAMEKNESGLVRITQQRDMSGNLMPGTGYFVPKHFGPNIIKNNVPAEGASNCDLNGDGKVDFASPSEGACSAACDADNECSEWTSYDSRGNYKVHNAAKKIIQIQTDGAGQFSPTQNPGVELTAVSGTLRNFSGGKLNWTIEVRCPDDLVCAAPGCSMAVTDSKHACVNITRTIDDNDQGTN